MNIRLRGVPGFGIALALVCLLLGGCGFDDLNSDDSPPPFEITGVGPGGGVVEAGDVYLMLPPGALSELTQISILPQEDPLPIDTGNDPCLYSFLGPLWCVGPVGHELLELATIRVSYDPNLIPAPFTASDLVLFLWDDDLGAFVLFPGVIHNVAEHYFEFLDLTVLGHVAVGIRDCPVQFGGIVYSAEFPFGQGGLVGSGGTQGEGPYPGLYIINMDDAVPVPQVLNTAHDGFATPPQAFSPPFWFIPSPDGTRVLYDAWLGNESSVMRVVELDPGATSIIVAGPPDQSIYPSQPYGDPFVGWLLDQTPPESTFVPSPSAYDVYFKEFFGGGGSIQGQPLVGAGGSVEEVSFSEWLSRRPGDAPSNLSPPSFPIATWPYPSTVFMDLRQSPNGRYMLLFVQDTNQLKPSEVGAGRYDIIDVPNGLFVSSGQIPLGSFGGGGIFIPRFTPDSSFVYQVDSDQQGVTRYNFDGTNPTTLWSPDLSDLDDPEILDFVLSPDGTRFAAIVRDDEYPEDYLYFGIPGNPGSVIEAYFFDDDYDYREVVFHPDGDVLYLDISDVGEGVFWSVIPFTLDETQAMGSRIVEHPELLASGIERLDINKQDGRLVQVERMGYFFDLSAGTPIQQSPLPGPISNIWISDKIGGNLVPVPLPTDLDGRDARWFFTVRNAPGMSDNSFWSPGYITPGIR